MGMLKKARVWYQTQQTKSKRPRMTSGSWLLGRTENGADDILVGKATVAGNILSQQRRVGSLLHHRPPLLALALALCPTLRRLSPPPTSRAQQQSSNSLPALGPGISVITKDLAPWDRSSRNSPGLQWQTKRNVKHQRPLLAATVSTRNTQNHRLCPRHGACCHLPSLPLSRPIRQVTHQDKCRILSAALSDPAPRRHHPPLRSR